ncbi:hypothetical protein BDQ12DRAFT_699430 [Crucibulum laeve]|uniref:Uncharacterized protein n=1 Tax=Crucibulum laeve TaxID=68775 RepID=A0A5C3LUT4_9AGAR|nr:hypothetical protein BDQ12DRAFT_699430 [Crucibulum laeve]
MDHSEQRTSPLDNVLTRQDIPYPRPSRIHFPANEISSRRDNPTKPFQPPFTGSPARRGSPLNPDRVINSQPAHARRRVRSIMDPTNPGEPSRPRRASHGTGAYEEESSDLFPMADLNGTVRDDVGLETGVFSDEYDLYPRILQDVQRALKMKARREARMKKGQADSPNKGIVSSVSPSSSTATSPARSVPFASQPSSPTPVRTTTHTPALDTTLPTASSSEGRRDTAEDAGPIPMSFDNGVTFDWGSCEEEHHGRRWTLSTNKRKDKDKQLPLEILVNQQEQIHSEKLSRIKTVATPQTLQKASVVKDQLGRRYGLLYTSLSSRPEILNLAKISRWHRSLEEIVRNSLEMAEPFTWLRHLDKRSIKPKSMSWHMSALIMEEYFHAQPKQKPMQTIPKGFPIQRSSMNSLPSHSPNYTPLPPPEPSSFRPKMQGSFLSYAPSGDSRTSLAPRNDKLRNFSEVNSRKSVESGLSSTMSNSSNPILVPAPFLATRSQPMKLGSESDASSAYHSEQSDLAFSKSISPQQPEITSDSELKASLRPDRKLIVSPDSLDGNANTTSEAPLASTLSASGRSENENESSSKQRSLGSARQVMGHRRVRISLPSRSTHSKTHQNEAAERNFRHEYEVKARLLEDATAHNQRIRQLLNRISVGIKEYELAQSKSLRSLGISQSSLPRELVDAFGHDPAAVTGATRRLRGWRAVEDIHHRLIKQREVFCAFLSQASGEHASIVNVLKDPITALFHNLDVLENRKDLIASRAIEVSKQLKAVQTMQANVKADYNTTLSNTSVVYPELSHIVALEESYRDQYQQFWEFGMDALTFLLDTVTPVWRTYGKRIGEDVRDFLIIPLYRNEFTGETKRYGIRELPKRSIRHWLGLVVFFLLSIAISILQIRGALYSSLHYRLQWIPYESIRWTVFPLFWTGILVQWLASVVELSVVMMQLGVMAWWTGWSVKVFT